MHTHTQTHTPTKARLVMAVFTPASNDEANLGCPKIKTHLAKTNAIGSNRAIRISIGFAGSNFKIYPNDQSKHVTVPAIHCLTYKQD